MKWKAGDDVRRSDAGSSQLRRIVAFDRGVSRHGNLRIEYLS